MRQFNEVHLLMRMGLRVALTANLQQTVERIKKTCRMSSFTRTPQNMMLCNLLWLMGYVNNATLQIN